MSTLENVWSDLLHASAHLASAVVELYEADESYPKYHDGVKRIEEDMLDLMEDIHTYGLDGNAINVRKEKVYVINFFTKEEETHHTLWTSDDKAYRTKEDCYVVLTALGFDKDTIEHCKASTLLRRKEDDAIACIAEVEVKIGE